MPDKTKIEWCDATWNPITGCTPVSIGCKNCYAKEIARRFWGDRKFSDILFHEDRLSIPTKWKKPRKIFVCSMSDLFHKDVPYEWIDKINEAQVDTPQHDYMWLTKRPNRAQKYIRSRFAWKPFVWLGVSVSTQAEADEKIPILLDTPAAVRFVSIEPMLEGIDLKNYFHCGISWCIFGCESGVNARPMKEEWLRKGILQCKENNIPVFYKQKMTNKKLIKMPFLDGEKYAEFPEILSLKEK